MHKVRKKKFLSMVIDHSSSSLLWYFLVLLFSQLIMSFEMKNNNDENERGLQTIDTLMVHGKKSKPYERFMRNNNSKINGDKVDDEPSDYEIWLAIKKSLEQWQAKQKNFHNRVKRNEEFVCYKSFGCFRGERPFDYLNTLPASPESIGTTFMLYTRKNPTEGQLLDYDNDTTLLISNFNASNNVKIIIHGFGSSSQRPWVLQMTEALLYLDDFNVINVDWKNGSKLPNYVQAAANTQLIGKQIAKLISMIDYTHKLTPSRYHLIGFSLGAHVAGFTGQEYRNISRITGLDPASPLFEGYTTKVRLDSSDATFVDVIHSNGDSFIRGGFGSYSPMGTVDFYPNGGRVQVGCNSVLMGAITDILYGKWNSLCNHRRAFRFFIDSVVRTCTFRSFACESYEEYIHGNCFDCGVDRTKCSNMGYFSYLSQGRGTMYLVTREKEPFCVNQFRIQIQFSPNQGVTWGRLEFQLIDNKGLNETFSITNEADELKESESIQALIVAHPQMKNITDFTLTYIRYKGWIYHGKEDWNIDRIELLDSNGSMKTYCNPGTALINTLSIRLKLSVGNCTWLKTSSTNHSIDTNTFSNSFIARKSQSTQSLSNEIMTSSSPPITDGFLPALKIHYQMAPSTNHFESFVHNVRSYPQFNVFSIEANRFTEPASLIFQPPIHSIEKSSKYEPNSMITPLLNGASKLFWKLWYQINKNSDEKTNHTKINLINDNNPQTSEMMISSMGSLATDSSSIPQYFIDYIHDDNKFLDQSHENQNLQESSSMIDINNLYNNNNNKINENLMFMDKRKKFFSLVNRGQNHYNPYHRIVGTNREFDRMMPMMDHNVKMTRKPFDQFNRNMKDENKKVSLSKPLESSLSKSKTSSSDKNIQNIKSQVSIDSMSHSPEKPNYQPIFNQPDHNNKNWPNNFATFNSTSQPLQPLSFILSDHHDDNDNGYVEPK